MAMQAFNLGKEGATRCKVKVTRCYVTSAMDGGSTRYLAMQSMSSQRYPLVPCDSLYPSCSWRLLETLPDFDDSFPGLYFGATQFPVLVRESPKGLCQICIDFGGPQYYLLAQGGQRFVVDGVRCGGGCCVGSVRIVGSKKLGDQTENFDGELHRLHRR